ncbi:MAG: GlcG/HbpS family heme-binding protein [bacterium]
MNFRFYHLSVAVLFCTMFSIAPLHAQSSKTVLTSKTAQTIIEGCEARARKEGWKMVTAIIDEGGNLKQFSRMDGAFLMSIKIAQLKAETSSGLPLATRKFREISRNGAPGFELVPGTSAVAGGLPIMNARGEWLGAVGVSGGSEDQDEVCAQAGLDAARDLLK